MTAILSPIVVRSPMQEGLDCESLFEIIDGQRMELPPMSILATRVASRLQAMLGHYAIENRLGEALTEVLVRLPLPVDRNRRPDVAFVSRDRINQAPPQPGSANAWDVVPELMVEVVSPNDLAEEIQERLGEYFAAGCRLVWVIYPTQRLVYVYEGLRQVRILGEADDLDGGTVLPGWRLPQTALYPE